MAKATIDMLVSILKYIDISCMSDEDTDSVYDLDINDEKNQKYVIRRLIVSGIKSEYSEEAFNRAKEVIVMGIKNIEAAAKIFEQMSFPFESDIVDKKTFLEIIYQELFEERDNY